MTIIRLRNQDVWIHNPICLEQTDVEWLASLGTVRAIVAPNQWHVTDFEWMSERFPEARLVCPQTYLIKRPQLADRVMFTNDLGYVTADRELEFFSVPGIRFEETVVFHPLSRTLILCDLMMNMPPARSILSSAFYKLNNMGECCAPTRVLKWLMTTNAKELLKFIEQLAELNPRRIIVNHGQVFEGEGGNQIRTAFASLFH